MQTQTNSVYYILVCVSFFFLYLLTYATILDFVQHKLVSQLINTPVFISLHRLWTNAA